MSKPMRLRRSTDLPLSRVTIIAQALIALIVGGFMFISAGLSLPFGKDHYTVTATIPDAVGLDPRDRPTVTVAGVRKGKVKDVRYAATAGRARVELALDSSAEGRLFADARLSIRPRSALGDLVVDVDPGDPSAGPLRDGQIRRVAQKPVGADQVFSILDADTRAYTQILLGTLRHATSGREAALRDALNQLPDTTDAVADVSRQLADRRQRLARLVTELDTISQVTARRGEQLASAIAHARRVFAVTDDQRQAVRASVRELPGVLRQTRETFGSVRALAVPLVPAAAQLRPTARLLPSRLRQTRALLPPTRRLLVSLDQLTADGRAPLRELTRVFRTLGPATRDLRPTVKLADAVVRGVAGNRPIIREMLGFWPSTMSTANDLSIVTRSTFFRVLPIKPGAVGMGSSSRAQTASLGSAERRLRAARPDLFATPDRVAGASVPLRVIQALLADRCQRKEVAACQILSSVYARPPRLLAR